MATRGGFNVMGMQGMTTLSAPLSASIPALQPLQNPLDVDADSTYDASVFESTASLTSSILAYRTLHGRTYNSDRIQDAQNWTPNDEASNEASDILHHMLTLTHDGELYRAPLKDDDIKKVLDVGTGTGIWAIDFADKFPNATVIGTDISPNQPTWVPPNVRFELDDATQDWIYPANDFDYIHMRYLLGSIPDWRRLLKQAYRCCKPGGYVESLEVSCIYESDDGSVKEGSPMDQWGKVYVEAGKKFGRPFDVVPAGIVQDAFRHAGFVDIVEWEFKCPIGVWPKDPKLKEIAAYALAGIANDAEGWVLYVWNQVMGWSKEEIAVYIAHLRKQLRDPNVHGYGLMRVVYARKPEADAPATS